MTYNSPKGEHAGTTGTRWNMRVWSTGETVVIDHDEELGTTAVGMNDPQPPKLNRTERRAMARALRASQGLKRPERRQKG